MRPTASVEALAGVGLQGDMHAIEGSTRQVLLIEIETLDALNLLPAMVKENITTQGIALMSLKSGQRLRIGSAVLQITKKCNPCGCMEEIHVGMQDALRDRRGMLARVLQGGIIRVGDTITLI